MPIDNPHPEMMLVQQALDLALQHHQAGRLAEAEAIYRRILSQQPNNSDALNLLGVIESQLGRHQAGVEFIRRAIAVNPLAAQYQNNLGLVLVNLGRLQDALAAYATAIKLNPDDADAHFNLGVASQSLNRLDDAMAEWRAAIALKFNYPKAHCNLGDALMIQGQNAAAAEAFRTALRLQPDLAEAQYNLGCALLAQGLRQDAIIAFRAALQLQPNLTGAYYNLGCVLLAQGLLREAIAAFSQALRCKPDHVDALNNMGCALRETGHLDQAIAVFRSAIQFKPDLAEAHNNLGTALQTMGQTDAAIAAYRQAISLSPNYAEAHNNLALMLLLCGDFKRGWEEHEWRWKCKDFGSPRRNFAQPQWDGSKLKTHTLLLHTEQGFGDALQFIRYLSQVAQRGGKIILECQADLQRLFQKMPEKYQILVRDEPLPAFDLHCPLLSLPLVFGTTLENVPNIVPYLRADAQDAGKWHQRMDELLLKIKVGLVWAGKPKPDRNRSMNLSNMAPLAQVPGIRFFSLQKGEAADEAKTPPAGLDLVDWTGELKDFADNAALIANLDLVISVDTAMAHLAGAMGKPVWTLLPFNPDWRWLLGRNDSPWYPTMRLFRQSAIGDWEGVIKRVAEELSVWIKNRGSLSN